MKRKESEEFKLLISEKKFFLVSNFHTYGIQHALCNYLIKNKAKEVYFLNHPLHGVSKQKYSMLEIYTLGKLISKKRIKRRSLPEPLCYLEDFLITLNMGSFLGYSSDIFIGFNSMNTLPGIMLKLGKKTNKVITYSHSLKSERFSSALLNKGYIFVDNLAVKYSDSVWGLGKSLVKIRRKQGVPPAKIVYAPDGVDTRLVKPSPYHPKKRFKLVFVGLVNKINGLELVVDALPKIIKWNRLVKLEIIGDGDDMAMIKKKVTENNLSSHVRYSGILPIEKLAKVLAKNGIGLATYRPLSDSTLKTTDPMKTKLYMAAGLPIISTDVYFTAKEISENNLGKLISYNVNDFVDAVKQISRENNYKKMRANGISFAKKYDWNVIFDNAFSKTFG